VWLYYRVINTPNSDADLKRALRAYDLLIDLLEKRGAEEGRIEEFRKYVELERVSDEYRRKESLEWARAYAVEQRRKSREEREAKKKHSSSKEDGAEGGGKAGVAQQGVDECSICMMSLEEEEEGEGGDVIKTLECGHRFHGMTCLDIWQATCRQNCVPSACPICRGPITEVSGLRRESLYERWLPAIVGDSSD